MNDDCIDLIEEIRIYSVDELYDYIRGKKSCADIRENYIFRGLPNKNFQLIPSALRRDDENIFNICNFTNKRGECANLIQSPDNQILSDFLYEQENKLLLEFLAISDKSGLKVPFNQRIREMIHRGLDKDFKIKFHVWPFHEYFEIMSLAQHYGLPTHVLDWTYDYNVALYFAVRDILFDEKSENSDCVLWALNYNLFEKNYPHLSTSRTEFPLLFYRPEYSSNSNLTAQKGLFTIWLNNINDWRYDSLDKLLIEELQNNKYNTNGKIEYKVHQLNSFSVEEDEKVFYKFVIPKELKPNFLKELYLRGYSEEFLFPGYDGVSLAIKNKVKLDQLLKK